MTEKEREHTRDLERRVAELERLSDLQCKMMDRSIVLLRESLTIIDELRETIAELRAKPTLQ